MIICVFVLLLFTCSVASQQHIDTEPPVITSWKVYENHVHLEFSKPISDFFEPFDRFFDIDERLNIADVRTDEPSTITLLLSDEIQCGFRYRLTVSKLEDAHGNTMLDATVFISTPCRADPHDIVINEIMADPSPSVRLPEYEYVELYNRSDKNIEIGGWTFSYGANNNRVLPEYLFPAGGYLLLAHSTAAPDLTAYGTTFPVLHAVAAITNSGQYMQLRDNEGKVISWVDFDSDWYADPLKSNGGWSLEKINPDLICSVESNWRASTSRNGGTPGQQNSVHATVSNIHASEIIRIAVPDNNTIVLYASNPLGNILPEASQFAITSKVEQVEIAGNNFDQLKLSLQTPLREGEWYYLSITGDVDDCVGYTMPPSSFYFSLPQDIDNFDVIINEIMFNPSIDGYSFVELYNRSQKAVRVSDLRLALRNNNGELPTTLIPLTDEPFLLLPEQYLVVSRNAEIVMQQYMATNRSAFLQVRNMPTLTRTSGRLVLLNVSQHIIDEVHYDSRQHADFLNLGNGVSLERINPDRNSLDPSNWHTAAQTVGFATPGSKNSQYMDFEIPSNTEVSVFPEVFSPDNDGFDDLLSINYRFDTPSLIADVIIFDSSGRIVRTIARQQLLATEGTFIWDGADDRGRKALTGIYIVFFQTYNSQGLQKVFKIPCVLAGNRR